MRSFDVLTGIPLAATRSPSRAALALALLLCFGAGGGCAYGEDGVNRRSGGGTVRTMDAAAPACDPPCAPGETCTASGACVPDGEDADSDGVEAAVDCDDTDPSVGRSGERLCASECGEGLTYCTDGVWSECDAPTECDCEPGTPPRTVACGFCGTQRQVCTDGTWTNDGACTNPGECVPGQVEMGGACGNCGTLQRTCGTDCAWSGWTCVGEGECAAGTTETDTEPCGTCGVRTRTRTCSS
ncbi:MAG TPA: hypothetical protein VIL20_04850, partial [Sandaracinaceae bacterium]